MWDAQAEVFSRQHQVLRYDLRGFGRSALPGSQPYQHEQDLCALLDHLDIEQAAVIGLSLGGMIALDFTLTYPDRVSALVLAAALYSGSRWSEEWERPTRQVWSIASAEGIPAARCAWLDHPIFKPTLANPVAGSLLTQMITDYSGWHFTHADPALSLEPSAASRLNQTTAPTLILVGEHDMSDFHRMADEMAWQISSAHKIVMPDVGHMVNMEDPDRFNGEVLRFLAHV
jgi:pimeloyl-ACP methyl ester carboxylesterase